MKKLFNGILFFVIVSFTFTSLDAQNLRGNFQRDQIGIKKLNLNTDQESKFDKIWFAHQEKNIDITSQLRKNQLEIKKIFSSNNISQQDVMDLTEKNSNLRAEIHMSKVNMWFDINKILNDEQKQIWKEYFNNFNGNRKAGFANKKSSRGNNDNFRDKGFRRPNRINMNN